MIQLLSDSPQPERLLLGDEGFRYERPRTILGEDELWVIDKVEYLSFRFESEPRKLTACTMKEKICLRELRTAIKAEHEVFARAEILDSFPRSPYRVAELGFVSRIKSSGCALPLSLTKDILSAVERSWTVQKVTREAIISMLKASRKNSAVPLPKVYGKAALTEWFALDHQGLWISDVELTGEEWSEATFAYWVQKQPQTGFQRPSLPEAVRHEVWRRDQGRCVRCGSQRNLEFDHVIPFSKGGSSTARNLQLLCEACNRSKAATV